MSHLQNEIKKEFQLERMIFFSDAVFAIAITLLVIELKVPELDEASDRKLLHALLHLSLKFIGFFISFFLIALFWTVHHRIFSFVENYNPRLLWLNLFYLFTIVLMPFSSGLYGEYSYHIEMLIPYTVYVLNICLIGVANYALLKYIGNPANHLASRALTSEIVKLGIKRTVVSPAVFLVSLLIAFLTPVSIWFGVIARFFPVFIPLVMRLVRNTGKKSTVPEPENTLP